MKRFIAVLIWSSLVWGLLGCQPTTVSPGNPVPESELEPALEIDIETAVSQSPTAALPTETAPTETAVSEAPTSPIPTKNAEFSVEPLPTISMEVATMPKLPGNPVEIKPENYPNAVDVVIQDLAGRLDIAESDIEVVYVASVIWPDASMGCPQPDMVYKQVPRDGIFIQLQADGKDYNYHGGGTRDPFLCESAVNLKQLPGPGGDMAPPPGLGDD